MRKSALLFVVFSVAVLAGLFVFMKPQVPVPAAPATTIPAIPNVPQPVAFEFVVKNGERTAGPVAMRVPEGEDVEIKVTSDRADEVHLHGYDLHTELKANAPAALYFKATHTGRFDLELHKANQQLGTLEVMPRQ